MAYQGSNTSTVVPDWLNKGDNAWQMVSATLVGMQGMPGLVLLYAGIVKKKWALNSAFMALYAFAAVMPCWVLWAYKLAFGRRILPFWGRPGLATDQEFLVSQALLPATLHHHSSGEVEAPAVQPWYPTASMVFFQFAFAAVTVMLLAGAVLGRMSVRAWMAFVPLWITFCYTVGAFSIWGGGFLFHWGVMDYSGGYVVHLASGAAGYTAAYWVGPRLRKDKDEFPPNNLLFMLAGAGILWLGWTGFNGGDPFAANVDSSVAVLNTHICAATSVLTWTCWDVASQGKPSIVGAIQGMITGLVCITPAAGLVQGWAALIMGVLSGSIPWYTMMHLNKRSRLLQKVDDTLGILHTHAIAGILGGALTGLFAHPDLCSMFLPVTNSKGAFYGGSGGIQFLKQLAGACFVIGWNVVVTSIILLVIRVFIPLRMSEEQLMIGDDAIHGEEAYTMGDNPSIVQNGLNRDDVENQTL
ncbi:ammonium transporter 3 member 1 [Elaeis guineensis]|uniref:Ammonium transporter n=1 Tax=Elaeis guineensis var. tenera TaxID=51953 RepID=A0A6I9R9Y1_ELAGV|nr:ammonium transporter 3 member 1 [Elaeis guineensis]